MSTIFSKIINKEIPANIVFESDSVLAFKDINPQAPVHILIIPKIEIPKVTDLSSSEHSILLGEMIDAANKIAKDLGITEDGFRLVFNCGENGGQEVYHLHLHLLGGRKMNWPPG
ncbi:MAG: histidine triad nucleotide-binding protein [Ignavibacterium sp.]|jgi:histidine triad (HIT) family protein|nr:histidine triad nucleotide-binding protein [Ignavibacterium sp.]